MNEPDLGWNGQGLSDALQPPEKKKQKSYEYAIFLSSLNRQLHRDTQMRQVKI